MSYSLKDDLPSELLNGQIVAMSPRPTVNHNRISENIYSIFRVLLKRNTCTVFGDGYDVYLSENDRVIPDVMIVCNPSIIKDNGIHGVPNLIVEVLSPSTSKNDRGYKKDLYAESGVSDYWIVDPFARSIEVYSLADGQYRLVEVASQYPNYILETMEEEEKSKISVKFQTPLFPDFDISIEEVFEDLPPF